MTATIEIYTTATCSYCVKAKELLKRKGVSYKEIHVDQSPEDREQMLKRSNGRRTVPQIFINDKHIGGYDDLWKLEQDKKLDDLLK